MTIHSSRRIGRGLGLFAGGLCLVAAAAGATPLMAQSEAASAERPLLVGTVTRADLQKAPFAEWYDKQYSGYQPASDAVERLQASLAGTSVEIYFGTWCGDSRREVPRFLRTLDAAGYDDQRVRLVALSDRPMEFMRSPGNPELARKVHRTPTFLVFRDGKEIGRIVETPTTSLESDLLAIADGRGPTPKFGAEALVHQIVTSLTGTEAEQAIEAASAEIAKRGDPDSLWHYAEYDLLRNNRALEAKAVLTVYLSLYPDSSRGHLVMSDALLALGRRPEALASAKRALALDPQNKRAQRAVESLQVEARHP